MVGVNRSNACITCIRRKKGCDRQKPACGQCRKSCIKCQGYERPRTFVNIQQHTFVRESPGSSDVSSQANMDLAVSKKLVRSARETSVLGQFWSSYYPNGKQLPTGGAIDILGGLMHLVQDTYTADDLLRKTIVAFSLSAISRQDPSCGWMREEGRKLYGDALNGAVMMLQNPRRRQEYGLLMVIRLFGLYEMLTYAVKVVIGDSEEQSLSWMTHCLGDAALVKDRGPLAYSQSPSHRLFVDGRLPLIMTALRTRKICFLSDPAWKKLPWSRNPKSPKDLLLDILVEVPTLFEAIDVMSYCTDPIQRADYQERLCMEYASLEKRLSLWYERFFPASIADENNTLVQDTVMPQVLAAAHLSTLYWATCVIVYGMVGKVLMTGYREEFFRERYVDPAIFCQEILRIIPLFLHYSTGIFRVHLATPPLSIMKIYLTNFRQGDMKKEKAMLARYLQDPSCLTMRNFMANMDPDCYEDTSVHEIVSNG